jgi:hypothetical protein
MPPEGPEFRDLVGEGLASEEEARLRRVHDLLVAAGPPPELPPELESFAEPRRRLPLLPRPRLAAAVVLAAASVAVAFGVGVLVGHGGGGGESFQTERVIKMKGTAAAPNSIASIDLGEGDSAGNWPLVLHVTQLPKQAGGQYYELWLTRRGKLVATCGTFRVADPTRTISIRLNAPYKLRSFDEWVVTDDHRHVLMRTV